MKNLDLKTLKSLKEFFSDKDLTKDDILKMIDTEIKKVSDFEIFMYHFEKKFMLDSEYVKRVIK